MGKERQTTKESKKPAAMTLKEKRAVKKTKKDGKGTGTPLSPR
jgi:hypothetical protein